MDRNEALGLINEKVKNKNLIKHMLATEAVMREIASFLGEDVEAWGIAGLIHDLDVELTRDNPGLHGKITADVLKGKKCSEKIIGAVLAHVGHKKCENPIEKVIWAVDPLTGFIVACALMVDAPKSEKLSSLTVDFCIRRFKEKRFAAGANREQIEDCRDFGMNLDEFIDKGIKAMQGIKESLEL